MTEHLRIRHVTTYTYDNPVDYGLQQLRLTPKSRHGQTVTEWKTSVRGGQVEVSFDDSHANRVQLISVDAGSQEVQITAEGTVQMTETSGVIGAHAGYMPLWMFLRPSPLTRRGQGTISLARDVRGMDDQLSQLHALSASIRATVSYDTADMDVTRTAEEAIAQGRGVCQDHAHIFVTAARLLDRPARYVSGYLKMDGREDQEATHAWAEAHVDGLGWVGFDVSNGISPDTRYVRVATGLDYADAAPIAGIRQGGSVEDMTVSVHVSQAQQ
ncbi:transglutaminase [Jannaschia pagri]|uniref:Transglutaminase n=1 Tax=Jannaschia pagri TaxID=2829797 RepID=A0ABQ4NRC9_9RHOB|nr:MULTISPECIES: transglutaminase family protein [unclassified Jannaschia]GIT92974.1 transglutaminase [Jannaschia sp. AI_61]GIT96809.1 transglutaminase [Jannaschia sp. AI_62]